MHLAFLNLCKNMHFSYSQAEADECNPDAIILNTFLLSTIGKVLCVVQKPSEIDIAEGILNRALIKVEQAHRNPS